MEDFGIPRLSWKKHLFPSVGLRMTSKQEFHATDKIGPVESNQESGLCHKFANSDITVIIKVLNCGCGFVMILSTVGNCKQIRLQRPPKTSMLSLKSWSWIVF